MASNPSFGNSTFGSLEIPLLETLIPPVRNLMSEKIMLTLVMMYENSLLQDLGKAVVPNGKSYLDASCKICSVGLFVHLPP